MLGLRVDADPLPGAKSGDGDEVTGRSGEKDLRLPRLNTSTASEVRVEGSQPFGASGGRD
jgi:hypothetical protein